MNFYLTTPASVMEARRRMFHRGFDELETMERTFSIPMDLNSNEDEYTISAIVPGLASEDVNIQFNNGVLSIEGEYPEKSTDGLQVHLAELPTGKFSRSIEFTDPIDSEKIEAVLKDGILTLHIPKAEEAKPKTIKVGTK
jgi:HSP20 family protein